MQVEKLKEKAEKFFTAGKWGKALNEFLRVSELQPADLRVRLKIAETLLRLERKNEAQMIFRQVADLYTRDGQLHKAISVNHRLLELDREDKDVQTKLAALYERHGSNSLRDLPVPPDEIEKRVQDLCADDSLEKVNALQKRLRQSLARSDWNVALLEAMQIWRHQPANLNTKLAIAQILQNLKRDREASDVFYSVANQFLQQGEPLRAAFVQAAMTDNKILDKRQEIIRRIAILYGRHGQRAGGEEAPAAERGFLANFRGRSEIMEEMLQDILVDPVELGKIKPVALLSHLPRKVCEALIEALRPVSLNPGEPLFHAGQTADCLYILSQGTVGIYAGAEKDLANRQNPLFSLGEGEILGSFGFLFDGRHQQSAYALEACEVLQLDRRDWENLCKQHSALDTAFDQLYRERVLAPLLSCNRVFAGLTPAQIQDLAERFRGEVHPDGNFEIREGQVPERMVFIRQGMLNVYLGKIFQVQPLANLGAGNCISELEWLTHTPSPFTFRAAGPLKVFCLQDSLLTPDLREILQRQEVLFGLLQARFSNWSQSRSHSGPLETPWGESLRKHSALY